MSEEPRFQFSLRTLLIAVTVAALLFALFRVLGVAPLMALFAAALIPGVICFIIATCVVAMHRIVVNTSANDPTSPVSIASAPTDVEASMIVADLQSHGIRAHAVGGFTSGFQAESPGEVQIVVARADSERAQELVAEFRAEPCDVVWPHAEQDASDDAP